MGKIAFVFSGQGAQYSGMGKELCNNSPAAKSVYDMADSIRKVLRHSALRAQQRSFAKL